MDLRRGEHSHTVVRFEVVAGLPAERANMRVTGIASRVDERADHWQEELVAFFGENSHVIDEVGLEFSLSHVGHRDIVGLDQRSADAAGVRRTLKFLE